MPTQPIRPQTIKENGAILQMSNCTTYEGLTARQNEELQITRLNAINSLRTNLDTPKARESLVAFYETLPPIKTGKMTMSPRMAANRDIEHLQDSIEGFIPALYWRGTNATPEGRTWKYTP